MPERRPLIAGNWKMNLNVDEAEDLIHAISDDIRDLETVDVLVAPAFTSLQVVKKAIGDSKILLAAQNMNAEKSGAFTGEVSGPMLIEAGCSHVILGHSERRSLFGETNEIVNLKVKAAFAVGLIPVVCIGESLEQREAGDTFAVIRDQLEGSLKHLMDEQKMPSSLILAYEPVWAIGTGKTATPDQAQEVHAFIRQWISDTFGNTAADTIRILYGGSVKPDNAGDLMSRQDIDGALVGGASLKAESFIPIIRF